MCPRRYINRKIFIEKRYLIDVTKVFITLHYINKPEYLMVYYQMFIFNVKLILHTVTESFDLFSQMSLHIYYLLKPNFIMA